MYAPFKFGSEHNILESLAFKFNTNHSRFESQISDVSKRLIDSQTSQTFFFPKIDEIDVKRKTIKTKTKRTEPISYQLCFDHIWKHQSQPSFFRGGKIQIRCACRILRLSRKRWKAFAIWLKSQSHFFWRMTIFKFWWDGIPKYWYCSCHTWRHIAGRLTGLVGVPSKIPLKRSLTKLRYNTVE